MKQNTIKGLLATVLFCIAAVPQVFAQYMPVVFDGKYGGDNRIHKIITVGNGEMVMIGKDSSDAFMHFSWLDRVGEVKFTNVLHGFITINDLTLTSDNCVLIVGQSDASAAGGKGKKDNNAAITGRVLIIDATGNTKTDILVGGQGSSVTKAAIIPSGDLIIGGYDIKPDGEKRGTLSKVSIDGKEHYTYYPVDGEYCSDFVVMGHEIEYVYAAFSPESHEGQASIVRLDNVGKPFYITAIPSPGFRIVKMLSNSSDGSLIMIGSSRQAGGMVYKLRPEGDIVFGRNIVPATENVSFEHLFIARSGNILVGGSGDRGHYAMLRNDGTSLVTGVVPGEVRGVGMNVSSGEAVVTSYDKASRRGTFSRISGKGKPEFERAFDGNFDKVYLSNNAEMLLLSTTEGRVCLYSAAGEKLSDRYISDNQPTAFDDAMQAPTGEVYFVGQDNRLMKLSHGLYVSDVKISKPVNGTATALFTVTLTGYSTTEQGAPVPVNVSYATKEKSAGVASHFIPVDGKLSFSPSNGVTDRYLVKQEIEVPIKANDMVEGLKEFELVLSEVRQSYLIKPVGNGVIEDQQALVKLIRTENGIEAEKDILYEIGLFKTDGSRLVNATGSNIIVDGAYGEGTADALDFEIGLTPRVVIPDNAHTGTFHARTLADTRYELPKTVVINFDKVYTISGTNVEFQGHLLSCVGTVTDQPAKVAMMSLGDQRVNNTVSGFFNITLQRASDGALLTNATGSDINVTCIVLPDGTAKEGSDFVLTNAHDLRILGDGNHSAVNVSGVVLHNPARTGPARVAMSIEGVTTPEGAPQLTIDAEAKTAGFNINN